MMKNLTTKRMLEFAGVDVTKGKARLLLEEMGEDMDMDDHEDAGHMVDFEKEDDHEEHGEGRNEMDAISMVKNQLQTIEREAKKLQAAIHDSEEIPEWMKAKITKAQDYIESVSEVMQSRHEDGQAVHDDEEGMEHDEEGMSTDGRKEMSMDEPMGEGSYDWRKHNANSGGRIFEIAAKGEGNYASAQAINAKMCTCEDCGKRISKATAFDGGSVGKYICKNCKEGTSSEQEEFGMSFGRKPSDRRSVSGSGRGDDKINPKMKRAATNAMTNRTPNGRYDGMKKRDWKNPF